MMHAPEPTRVKLISLAEKSKILAFEERVGVGGCGMRSENVCTRCKWIRRRPFRHPTKILILAFSGTRSGCKNFADVAHLERERRGRKKTVRVFVWFLREPSLLFKSCISGAVLLLWFALKLVKLAYTIDFAHLVKNMHKCTTQLKLSYLNIWWFLHCNFLKSMPFLKDR